MSARPQFFTISDARFFPGTAALLNSLRLTGHTQELVILDRGLTQRQRDSFAGHATVVGLPNAHGKHPVALKPFPAHLMIEGVAVIIDSDMIVTDSLEPILDRAAAGKICMFPEIPYYRRRWFAEWEEVFSLAAPPRHQPYMNAGFVALSTEHWPHLLKRWWDASERIPPDRIFAGELELEPLWAGDQDALNAILMSEVPEDALEQLPPYAPHTKRVVVDKKTLVCTHDGRRQPLLHEALRPKAWQQEGWRRVRANGYARLMPRVLFAPDVAVRVDPADVPLWVRSGAVPGLTLRALSALTKSRAILARARRAPRRAARETRQALEWARSARLSTR